MTTEIVIFVCLSTAAEVSSFTAQIFDLKSIFVNCFCYYMSLELLPLDFKKDAMCQAWFLNKQHFLFSYS